MASHGLPAIPLLLGVALAVEAAGTVCLLTGVAARHAALIMFFYLLAVSVLLHGFWAARYPASAGMLQTHFFKNPCAAGPSTAARCFG